MAKEEKKVFKPIFKAKFSSGGAIQNFIIPQQLDRLLNAAALIEAREKSGIILLLSSLSAILPFYSKIFPHYPELKAQLTNCRNLREHWVNKTKTKQFPDELGKALYALYEGFLLEFNESGAGIEFTRYDPNAKQKEYDFIVGNPYKS